MSYRCLPLFVNWLLGARYESNVVEHSKIVENLCDITYFLFYNLNLYEIGNNLRPVFYCTLNFM